MELLHCNDFILVDRVNDSLHVASVLELVDILEALVVAVAKNRLLIHFVFDVVLDVVPLLQDVLLFFLVDLFVLFFFSHFAVLFDLGTVLVVKLELHLLDELLVPTCESPRAITTLAQIKVAVLKAPSEASKHGNLFRATVAANCPGLVVLSWVLVLFENLIAARALRDNLLQSPFVWLRALDKLFQSNRRKTLRFSAP